ncbi:MAG: hypothetical protein NZ703_08020, partial [Gemmataceae bacterium]|nr:hypothetical protein [Gemmataceae bacterium]
MKRLFWQGLALGLVLVAAWPAAALRIAYFPPTQRAIHSEVVVIGKVVGIEKQPVDLAPAPGATDKVTHKVALIKVQENLTGADNLTHLKIAYVPPAAPPPEGGELVPERPIRPIRPPIRPGLQLPELREGDEFLFFLVKHPGGSYYMMPGMYPPIPVKKDDEGAKKEIEMVRKVTAALAQPLAGLKSDKPEVRAQTAAILIMKYRSAPMFAQQVEQVPIDAELSRLILQALAEADWSQQPEGEPFPIQPAQAFYSLG